MLLLIGISAGITIGSAAAAFFTLLKFVPRIVQVTDTGSTIKLYEYMIILGSTFASFVYFSNFKFGISMYCVIPVGIIMGMFYGVFASALAEVLNVIPVFVKKFKAKHELMLLISALILGKFLGALFYWLVFKKV